MVELRVACADWLLCVQPPAQLRNPGRVGGPQASRVNCTALPLQGAGQVQFSNPWRSRCPHALRTCNRDPRAAAGAGAAPHNATLSSHPQPSLCVYRRSPLTLYPHAAQSTCSCWCWTTRRSSSPCGTAPGSPRCGCCTRCVLRLHEVGCMRAAACGGWCTDGQRLPMLRLLPQLVPWLRMLSLWRHQPGSQQLCDRCLRGG